MAKETEAQRELEVKWQRTVIRGAHSQAPHFGWEVTGPRQLGTQMGWRWGRVGREAAGAGVWPGFDPVEPDVACGYPGRHH